VADLTVHVLFSIIGRESDPDEDRHVSAPGLKLPGDHPARETGRLGFVQADREALHLQGYYRQVGEIAARLSRLAPGCCVDRHGAVTSRYDDSEIQRQARKLALASVEKIFRGT
jgi:hypothetical protein